MARLLVRSLLCLGLAACTADSVPSELDGAALPLGAAPETDLSAFAAAAAAHDVPEDLLLALAWAETRMFDVHGHDELGLGEAHGVMALRSPRLEAAAGLAGLDPEAVRFERTANVAAAAAWLSQ